MSRYLVSAVPYCALLLTAAIVFSNDCRAFSWQKRAVAIENLTIPAYEGVRLKARLYMPKSMLSQADSRPTIILISPWSVGILIYESKARELAQRGYQVLAYSSRGWAGSEGEVDTGGSLDRADAQIVLDWLIDYRHADPSRIGAAGISLGAGTALMAAAFDPRIKVVASLSGWSELYTSLFGNNTERYVWGAILDIAAMIGGGKFPVGQQHEQKASLKNRHIEKLRAYTDQRSPINYLDRFQEHQTAIFISHNINDYLFPSHDIWNFFQKLQTPKAIRLQPGIHASTEVIEIFGIGEEVWDDMALWFDHWLQHEDKPLPEWADASIKIRPINSDTNMRVDQQSLQQIAPKRWFLSAGSRWNWGSLLAEENSVHCCDKFSSGRNSGVNSGIPLAYPLINSFTPLSTNINPILIRKSMAAIYKMQNQGRAFDIMGVPRIHLNVSCNREMGQIVVYLFRIDRRGRWYLVSLTPYTFYDKIANQPFVVDMEFFNGFASIRADEQLVLAIDAYDLQFTPVDRRPFDIEIRTDLGAYLELPMQTF